MRKWICLGVLGGLLEFGIVYQVAFSGSDSPTPETPRAAEGTGPKPEGRNARKAGRSSPRHIASAVGSADQASPATPTVAANLPTGTGNPPAATSPDAGSPASPVRASASSLPADDPLTATLKAAVSAVAALPISLGIAANPAEGELIPGLPVSLAGVPPVGGAEDLANVTPPPTPAETPAPAPAPPPLDASKLPVEELIRHVFGDEGDKAVEVARCESTLRTHAKKGQFLGLFQMGANERANYGHGPDALSQVEAAHALFLDRGWQPWTCA